MRKHIKAAADPSPPGGYDSDPDCDPNTELVSTPNTKVKDSVRPLLAFPDVLKYRDPLRLIQDYIFEVSTTEYWPGVLSLLSTIRPILT